MGNSSRKFLFVAFDFPPVRTSAAYRVSAFARYLPQFGWQPIVLSVKEKVTDVLDEDLLSGISRELKVHRTGFVDVTKWENLVSPPKATVMPTGVAAEVDKKRSWRRVIVSGLGALIRSALYFPDSFLGWIPFSVMRAVRLYRDEDFDLIFSTNPPKTAALVGYLIKVITGKPWVLEFMDPWYPPKGGIRRRCERMLQALLIKRADLVVAVTKAHGELLQRQFRVPDEKIVVIPNGFEEGDFASAGARSSSRAELELVHFGTVYSGLSGLFFDAVSELLDEEPQLSGKFLVRIVGFPDAYTRNYYQSRRLNGVLKLEGFIKHSSAIEQMCKADGLLLFLGDQSFSNLVISGKLYEYLRSGRPILAIAYKGELTNLIDEAKAGWSAEPSNIAEIKRMLRQFLADAGSNIGARREFSDQFSWKQLSKTLALNFETIGCSDAQSPSSIR